MKPNGGGAPSGKLGDAITAAFGSLDEFKTQFKNAGATQFGSGWAWLVTDKAGKLTIEKTPNAVTPMAEGRIPILTMDVWEHAYYLDVQNRRCEGVCRQRKSVVVRPTVCVWEGGVGVLWGRRVMVCVRGGWVGRWVGGWVGENMLRWMCGSTLTTWMCRTAGVFWGCDSWCDTASSQRVRVSVCVGGGGEGACGKGG